MHYNRLAGLVIAANLTFLWAAWPLSTRTLGHAALANLALAVIVRQQYVVNLLFRLATWPPPTWPLKIRWTLGKVYHFGGLHVGGALAGTAWFLALTATTPNGPLTAVGWTLLALLALVIATALPPSAPATMTTSRRSTASAAGPPSPCSGRTPCCRPRDRRHWRCSRWSPSAWRCPGYGCARWPYASNGPPPTSCWPASTTARPFAGSSTAISRSPLREWHSFANVPAPGEPGFRLTISRAGDWTGAFIDDLPAKVWVKGITTAGVANIETLFTKVVYVATGSGIGPCLPHLLAAEVPSRLVWATRDPRTTYGDALVDEILAVQPHALIWDTRGAASPTWCASRTRPTGTSAPRRSSASPTRG